MSDDLDCVTPSLTAVALVEQWVKGDQSAFVDLSTSVSRDPQDYWRTFAATVNLAAGILAEAYGEQDDPSAASLDYLAELRGRILAEEW